GHAPAAPPQRDRARPRRLPGRGLFRPGEERRHGAQGRAVHAAGGAAHVTDVSDRPAGADSPAEALIKVSALREGTVIDQLVAGTALKVLSVLGMTFEGAVTIGLNLDSRKAGRKDIIKIERRELTPAEVARIALISPRATFSIIRDFKVVRKFTPELPD